MRNGSINAWTVQEGEIDMGVDGINNDLNNTREILANKTFNDAFVNKPTKESIDCETYPACVPKCPKYPNPALCLGPTNRMRLKFPKDTPSVDEVIKTGGEGKKFDTDKLRVELLPIEPLEKIAEILTFGAKKYGERNWEKGMKWSRLFGAGTRHFWAWFKGEDYDKESGLLHLAHLGCCVLFLLEYFIKKTGTDDRPIKKENKKS